MILYRNLYKSARKVLKRSLRKYTLEEKIEIINSIQIRNLLIDFGLIIIIAFILSFAIFYMFVGFLSMIKAI